MKFKIILYAFILALLEVPAAESQETLSLEDCIASALRNNKEIIEARRRIKEVAGEATVVRSRFLLHLDVLGKYDIARHEPDGEDEEFYESSVRANQRLLEFGRDAPAEVSLREDQRQAIYNYESKARETLSNVRRAFFTVILRGEQIKIRQGLLEEFQRQWEKAKAKRERRMASPLEDLTAELNVLTEEERINALSREQFREKMKLLRLIGRPIGGIDAEISGELSDFEMSEDEAVKIALKNSFEIALAQEWVEEQERAVREIDWEYMPDLAFQAGVESGRKRAGLGLSNANDTWGLDLSSEYNISQREESLAFRGSEQTDWYVNLQLSVPILEGLARRGRYRREGEKLEKLRAELENRKELIELNVRMAYQSLMEAAKSREIQERAVRIAKRRFEIFERFRELGRVGDEQVETFRKAFFTAQDMFFREQDNYIKAQEDLRRIMGYFD